MVIQWWQLWRTHRIRTIPYAYADDPLTIQYDGLTYNDTSHTSTSHLIAI